MPMYSYKCFHCGVGKTVMKPMSKSDRVEQCDECSRILLRDFKADLFHTANDTYDKPIISDSMAVSPDQIAEHRATFPDIRMTDQGQPIFENYAKHEAYLKKTGFVKHPGKIRKRVKKVTTV